MTTEPLHTRLWRENRTLAGRCLDHPFIRGIGDGTLDEEAFERYVAQDVFFLRAFFNAYALAAVRAGESWEVVDRLHRLMGGVLEELKLHEGYAESLNIDLDELRPLPATSAYTDFLLRTAWTAGAGEIMAAMTPCMRLYAFLGQELAKKGQSQSPYKEWIETYSSADFEELAAGLELLLDELADETTEVVLAYRYALRCEYDFFSAPLAGR